MKLQFDDQEPTGSQIHWKNFGTHGKAKSLPLLNYVSAGLVVLAAVVVIV